MFASGQAVLGQAPSWRRWLRRHRRPIAAVCAAAGLLLALQSIRPAPPATEPVLVAAHDLAPGAAVSAADVAVIAWPAGLAPPGALHSSEQLPGRPLAGPVGTGEPLVLQRFLAPSVLAAYGAGMVATPVRLADAGAASLLRPGDVVDVLAAAPSSAGDPVTAAARVVASSVRVLLGGTGLGDSATSGELAISDGSLVVLATTSAAATAIAGAAATSRLSVVLRAG